MLIVPSLTSYLGTAHEPVLILTSGWFSIHIRLTIIPNVPSGKMSSAHLSGGGHCAHPSGYAPSLQLFGHLELPVEMYTREQQNFLTNISDYHQVSLLILIIQREKASWNVLLIVFLKLFSWTWREVPVFNSILCSCRGPWFSSRHPHQVTCNCL